MDRMVHIVLNAIKQVRVDQRVNAQNLASSQVAGFKKDMPLTRTSAFLDNMNQYNSRIYVTSDDKLRFSSDEGFVEKTEGKMDFSITGPGWFYIDPPQGLGPALSRRGDFNQKPTGELVDGAGNYLLDKDMNRIVLPEARNIIIESSGQIIIEPFGSPEGTRKELGILATTMADDVPLMKYSDGQIRPEQGIPMPEPDNQALIVQGSLERSNVETLEGLIKNIEGQRTFELNVKFLKKAEELDKSSSSLMRMPG